MGTGPNTPHLLRRVCWQDGDVITEKHFSLLERWISELVGITARQTGMTGFIRHPLGQAEYNTASSVLIAADDGRCVSVEIKNLQVLDRSGRIATVHDRKIFHVPLSLQDRTPDGNYTLFLTPLETRQPLEPGTEEEPAGGCVDYEPAVQISAQRGDETAVPIVRFRLEDSRPVLDPAFVPPSVRLDSSSQAEGAHQAFLQKFTNLVTLFSQYIETSARTADTEPDWSFATQILRACATVRARIESSRMLTLAFFQGVQELSDSVRAELQIFASWTRRPEQSQVLSEALATFEGVPLFAGEPADDIGPQFQRVHGLLASLANVYRCLAHAKDPKRVLAIAGVEIVREAAFNKLKILLEKEETFVPGRTRMVITMREFSRADPTTQNVRVGLGSAIFAQLLVLSQGLNTVPGRSFTYSIETPPEVITREKASQITLYLPPPLGEGIPDLRSKMSIVVHE